MSDKEQSACTALTRPIAGRGIAGGEAMPEDVDACVAAEVKDNRERFSKLQGPRVLGVVADALTLCAEIGIDEYKGD